jgi:hypothetical protein
VTAGRFGTVTFGTGADATVTVDVLGTFVRDAATSDGSTCDGDVIGPSVGVGADVGVEGCVTLGVGAVTVGAATGDDGASPYGSMGCIAPDGPTYGSIGPAASERRGVALVAITPGRPERDASHGSTSHRPAA